MAHKHSVYDTDAHFKVDPKTRSIINTSLERDKIIMQRDHNSERLTFEMPRFVEGHDMSLCDKIEVHYENIEIRTKEKKEGVYIVDDKQLSPEDENIVIFSWLISRNATLHAGVLEFSLTFSCLGEGAVIEYEWGTDNYKGVLVKEKIHNTETVVEEYPDALEQLKQEVLDEIPETLPNPHPLRFTGIAKGTYDGSEPVEVEIPSGIPDVTTEDEGKFLRVVNGVATWETVTNGNEVAY